MGEVVSPVNCGACLAVTVHHKNMMLEKERGVGQLVCQTRTMGGGGLGHTMMS